MVFDLFQNWIKLNLELIRDSKISEAFSKCKRRVFSFNILFPKMVFIINILVFVTKFKKKEHEIFVNFKWPKNWILHIFSARMTPWEVFYTPCEVFYIYPRYVGGAGGTDCSLHYSDDAGENTSFLGMMTWMPPLALCPCWRWRQISLARTLAPIRFGRWSSLPDAAGENPTHRGVNINDLFDSVALLMVMLGNSDTVVVAANGELF